MWLTVRTMAQISRNTLYNVYILAMPSLRIICEGFCATKTWSKIIKVNENDLHDKE